MITVSINGTEGQWPQVGPQWINQQINFWKRQGKAVCVKILVELPDIKLEFFNGTCGNINSGGAGTKVFSVRELKAIEIWKKLGLMDADLEGGKIVAFLSQLSNSF